MQFNKTIQQVLSGLKTQTRRLVQPGDRAIFDHDLTTIWVVHRNGRLLYQVGKVYAAQAGRGQPAAGRIRLKSIRKQRVNEISEGDALAEGVTLDHYYCDEGTNNDPTPIHRCDPVGKFADLWNTIHTGAAAYENGPECWVLTLELCEGGLRQCQTN